MMTTHHQLRGMFVNARNGLTYDNATKDEVMVALCANVPKNATPEAWVQAITSLNLHCNRCGCTGTYQEPPGGICYRCGGKGVQGYEDGHRNRTHDEHHTSRAG